MMEPHLVLLAIICLAAYWAVWYTPGRVLEVGGRGFRRERERDRGRMRGKERKGKEKKKYLSR